MLPLGDSSLYGASMACKKVRLSNCATKTKTDAEQETKTTDLHDLSCYSAGGNCAVINKSFIKEAFPREKITDGSNSAG